MKIDFRELNVRFHLMCIFRQMELDYRAGEVSISHLKDWLKTGAAQFVPNNVEHVERYRAEVVKHCALWLNFLENGCGFGSSFSLNFTAEKEPNTMDVQKTNALFQFDDAFSSLSEAEARFSQ